MLLVVPHKKGHTQILAKNISDLQVDSILEIDNRIYQVESISIIRDRLQVKLKELYPYKVKILSNTYFDV